MNKYIQATLWNLPCIVVILMMCISLAEVAFPTINPVLLSRDSTVVPFRACTAGMVKTDVCHVEVTLVVMTERLPHDTGVKGRTVPLTSGLMIFVM